MNDIYSYNFVTNQALSVFWLVFVIVAPIIVIGGGVSILWGNASRLKLNRLIPDKEDQHGFEDLNRTLAPASITTLLGIVALGVFGIGLPMTANHVDNLNHFKDQVSSTYGLTLTDDEAVSIANQLNGASATTYIKNTDGSLQQIVLNADTTSGVAVLLTPEDGKTYPANLVELPHK